MQLGLVRRLRVLSLAISVYCKGPTGCETRIFGAAERRPSAEREHRSFSLNPAPTLPTNLTLAFIEADKQRTKIHGIDLGEPGAEESFKRLLIIWILLDRGLIPFFGPNSNCLFDRHYKNLPVTDLPSPGRFIHRSSKGHLIDQPNIDAKH
jgi:hypothetical protein